MSVKDYYIEKLGIEDLYYNWDRAEVIDFIKKYYDDLGVDVEFEHVLEIGCAYGKAVEPFKKAFKTSSYRGVELIKEAVVQAEKHMDQVVHGDFEDMIRQGEFEGLDDRKYDVIMCLDVLEHLVDPWETLTVLKSWIKDNGILVTSLPNAGNHLLVRKLLNDKLEYEDRGILDVTHLRYYTRHTIEKMLHSTGFKVQKTLAQREYMTLRSRMFNAITFGRFKTLYDRQYIHISTPANVTSDRFADADSDSMLKVYFGHHKCASTWATLVIEKVCIEMGIKYGILYQKVLDKYDDVQDYLNQTGVRFLIIPEASYDKAEQITEPFRGFNLIRDPRDIVVSAYFSHMHSHPTKYFEELTEHRKELQHLSQEKGLLEEIDFCKPYMDNLNTWTYNDPRILELKYEEMIVDPKKMFHEVFKFLMLLNSDAEYNTNSVKRAVNRVGNRMNTYYLNYRSRTITADRLDEILDRIAFSRLTKGRKRGEEDVKSHYRKGVAKDWLNHFSQEHIDYFNKQYPNLLETLKYPNKDE